MAVVDDLAPGMDSSPPNEEFGRQPPQDLAAEQSVLGGMLLSKDAIADVLEKLRPGDFYRPAHQNVYDAILDLYGRGEPADAVTVAAELDRRGLLRRVGGAPYLHTLISMVPTAANGEPAFAAYSRKDERAPWTAHSIHVLTLEHEAILRLTLFYKPDGPRLFDAFGLPLVLQG